MRTHDKFCDGFAFAHIADVHESRHEGGIGPVMYQARCRKCDWNSWTTSGKAGLKAIRKEADRHFAEKPCEGECLGRAA